jgi:hypothetical protein
MRRHTPRRRRQEPASGGRHTSAPATLTRTCCRRRYRRRQGKEAQATVFQQSSIVWIRDVMRAFLMFIFLKKRKKCHDSYTISPQKACNHIANEIVQRNTLNRSTVQDRKSINDRISLILRRHRIFELIEIDFNNMLLFVRKIMRVKASILTEANLRT